MSDLFDIEELEKTNNRIKELEVLIQKHQKAYYNGEAEISDFEFDKLWDELKEIDPQNKILQKVGADSVTFSKIKHVMPMGSQEKAANPEQFLSWRKNMFTTNILLNINLMVRRWNFNIITEFL